MEVFCLTDDLATFFFAFAIGCFAAFHMRNGLLSIVLNLVVVHGCFQYTLRLLEIKGNLFYLFAIFCGSMCGHAISIDRQRDEKKIGTIELIIVVFSLWYMRLSGILLLAPMILIFALYASTYSKRDYILYVAILFIMFIVQNKVPLSLVGMVYVIHLHVMVIITFVWICFCRFFLPYVEKRFFIKEEDV